jgi:pyruvate-formate lyase-activating enzyme
MDLTTFLEQTPRCVKPWASFEMDDATELGPVRPCCWSFQYIGDLRHSTLAEIWNGNGAQTFRHAMLTGQVADYCPDCCPIWQEPVEEKTAYWKRVELGQRQNALLNREEILAGRTILESRPVTLKITPSLACNLDCVMCYQVHSPKIRLSQDTLAGIERWLPVVDIIHLQGGEVFVANEGLRLLKRTLDFPHLLVGVITNGNFPRETAWDLLKKVRFEWLIVSLDAATAETYRQIRIRGDWDRVIDNLHRLCAIRRQRGNDFKLYIDMTVMRTNYNEIPLFVELASLLKLDAAFHMLTPEARTAHMDPFNSTSIRDTLVDLLRCGLELAKNSQLPMATHTLKQLLTCTQAC